MKQTGLMEYRGIGFSQPIIPIYSRGGAYGTQNHPTEKLK